VGGFGAATSAARAAAAAEAAAAARAAETTAAARAAAAAEARAIAAAEARASTPVGRKGSPLDVTPGTNAPATIGGREYSGHALDQIQGRGLTPSVVENTIRSGQTIPGKIPGTTAHFDPVNKVTVVTDTVSGRVVTAAPGKIKQ
jgi:hypothetical protein